MYELTWVRSVSTPALCLSMRAVYDAHTSGGMPFGYFASSALICLLSAASDASVASMAALAPASRSLSVASCVRSAFFASMQCSVAAVGSG